MYPFLFQFEVVATDGGKPQRSADLNAIVSVTVLRNDHGPYFINIPTAVDIDETDTTVFYTVIARDNDTTVSKMSQ